MSDFFFRRRKRPCHHIWKKITIWNILPIIWRKCSAFIPILAAGSANRRGLSQTLCGGDGASAVYGPQKGTSEEQVAALDQNLGHYADVIEKATGKRFRTEPGARALAGSIGFGMVCLLSAKLRYGIQVIMDVIGIDEKMK